ncbi:MAG: helix-turn-helix domain-containing protein [Candidatus Onthoplasma sp.]
MIKYLYMDILTKIDRLRIEKGWTIYQLAQNANISQSTLSNMTARKTLPSISTLQKICEAFNMTLSEFFSEETENSQNDLLLQKFNKLSKADQQAILHIISRMPNH